MTENEKFLNKTHVSLVGVLFKNPWSELSLVQ